MKLIFYCIFIIYLLSQEIKEENKEKQTKQQKEEEEETKQKSYELFNLQKEFYNEFIDSEEFVFVKYFAPWCQHCQKLQPEFIKTAQELYKDIRFAEVNCEEQKEICKTEHIESYPTLFFFRKGRSSKRYEGERTSEKMVNWLKQNMQQSLLKINEEEAKKLKEDNIQHILIKADPEDGIVHKMQILADDIETIKFYYVEKEDEDIPTFELYNSELKETYKFDWKGDEKREEVVNWIIKYSLPLFEDASPQLFRRIQETNMFIGWYFYDGKINENEEKVMLEVAKKLRGEVIIMKFNKHISVEQVKTLRHSGEKYPVLSVIHRNKRNIYVIPEDTPIEENKLLEEFNKIISGKAKVDLVSAEPVPEDKQGEVREIVGSELDSFLKTEGKDNLVIFCVLRSDFCKYYLAKVAPRIVKRFENITTINIAWLDALKSDVDSSYNLNVVPSLYLSKDDEKRSLISFGEKMPSEKEVADFLFTNCEHKFELPKELPPDEDEQINNDNDDDDDDEDDDDEEEEEKRQEL